MSRRTIIDFEDLGPFNGIFGKKNFYTELLQLFLSIPDISLNQSQLARVLGSTNNTIVPILHHLYRFNIIRCIFGKGQEKIWLLNTNHPVVQILDKLNIMVNMIEEPVMELLYQPAFNNRYELIIENNIDSTGNPYYEIINDYANTNLLAIDNVEGNATQGANK